MPTGRAYDMENKRWLGGGATQPHPPGGPEGIAGPPRHPPPSQIPEGALGGGGQVTPPSGATGGGKGGATQGVGSEGFGLSKRAGGAGTALEQQFDQRQQMGGGPGGGKGGTPTGYEGAGYTPQGYFERQKGLGEGSMLPKFGYQGELGVNPMEQLGLGQIAGMAGQQTPMQTTLPAQQTYEAIAGGEFGPQGQKFRGDVYEATKTGAMENLADLQKQMGESFAHRGGYFGGQHALAQAKLAEQTASPLNQLLGGLNLQGFQGDIANRLTAAGGLGGLASTQRGIESSLLGDVMGGGQMLTERELQNRQLYQGASDRAYQDWTRAKQERMAPMNLIPSLLGAQTTQPVVQMPGQSSGGLLGNLLGTGIGAFTGGVGGGLGSALGGK